MEFIYRVTSNRFIGATTSLMIVLLFFGYPISAVSSLFMGIPATIVNILYRFIIMLMAVYVIIVLISKHNLSIQKFSIPILLFLIVYLIRIIYDTFISDVQTTHTITEIYTFYLGNILLPFIAIILSFKYVNLTKFCSISLFFLLVSNVLIILTYFIQIEGEISPLILLRRASIHGLDGESEIVNSITYGLNGGSLLLLCLCFLLIVKKNQIKNSKLFLRFGLFLGLVNLMIGGSRGPFIFTLLGLLGLLYFYIYFSKIDFKFLLKAIFASVLFFFTLIFISYLFLKNGVEFEVLNRIIATKENIESGNQEERNLLYSEAVDMFMEEPLFGSQMNLKSLTYPHNLFLEILMSTGIFGIILFLIGLFLLFFVFFNFYRYSRYFCIFIIFFILTFGISMTTGNLYQNVILWNLIALMFSWPKTNSEQTVVV